MEKLISYFMMLVLVTGSFAPFLSAATTFDDPSTSSGFYNNNYGSTTNTWQGSRPTFDSYYSGSLDSYWPILTNLKNDQCDAVSSDFVVMIPPGGCEPSVVRSDLLAEQNVPVFCQLSAIRVNPLIDVSTIKSISFKGDYPDEVAGISFHPARAAVNTRKTLLGDPIEENIGYVVIVLKKQPDERDLAEYVSGMLTATIKYDAQGAFGTGAGEYYLRKSSDSEWNREAAYSSFWGGKGYLRVTNIDSGEATIEVLTDKDNVYRTLTLKEGETSKRVYYPGYSCTAALSVKLNKIDNSEDMAKIDIDGDVFWVRKGSRLLDGKCRVKDLKVFPGGSGEIEISCSGSKSFRLGMEDNGVVLENYDKKNINVKIGGAIEGTVKKNYYLGYYGMFKGEGYAVMFDKSVNLDEIGEITGVFETREFGSKEEVSKAIENQKIFRLGGEYFVLFEDDKDDSNGLKFVSSGDGLSGGKFVSDSGIPKYMDEVNKTVLQLVDEFPAEKRLSGEYWGEEALFEAIRLAGVVGDENMQLKMINRFLEEYPKSSSVEHFRNERLKLGKYNYRGSSINVDVNNDNYDIRVDGFVSGGGASDKVNIRVGSSNLWGGLRRGGVYYMDGENNRKEIVDVEEQEKTVPRLTVVNIDGASAKFEYAWKEEDKKTEKKTFSVAVGSYLNVGGTEFYVDDTNVREVAYVSLIPEVRNTKTEANFTFNIGIEKRELELSPEKAIEKIEKLNKSIAEWEDRVEKLGELVKGMKAACFAVSTVLTLKTMITGFSGGVGIAREKVMDRYKSGVCKGKSGVELQRCYSENSAEIEAAIEAYGAGVVAVNKRVKCAENKETVNSGFLKVEVADTDKYFDKLEECVELDDEWHHEIGDTIIKKGNLKDVSDYQAVLLKEEVCKDGDSEACKIATAEMEMVLRDNVDRAEVENMVKNLGITMDEVYVDSSEGAQTVIASVAEKDKEVMGQKIKKGGYYKVIKAKGGNYLYILEKGAGGLLSFESITSSSDMSSEEADSLATSYNFIAPSGKTDSCSNEILNPYVRYREENNKQGFAAVVPFDLKEGWYAYIKDGEYYDSGQVKSFYICNVGSDKTIDDGPGRDICAQFISGSTTYFTPCSGKSDSYIKKLHSKAEDAIREANKNGDGLTVDGRVVHKTKPLGPASADVGCADFMSVDDCNIMFNVCDPVICPSSRCDMGGAFPVADVISTGIIGSIALCLPNFGSPSEGGVLIPVCLSGVHAGIDSYLSILKSYRSCLEHNVETGEYLGICDEISAIYMCEFFWGQISPIFDVLVSRIVGSLYGAGSQTKGGAEYMTISKSFENLDKSVDYFTSTYAAGSFRAFDLRNTQEIGSTVCKGFVGSSVPTSADTLDSLVEPDSPTQFYAYFSDDVFTDVTVPSTSHYKVYYHIYAGNDAGTNFKVYLKNPPESSYYSSRQTLLVESGYVAKGVAVDEAKDFTAPTGYKELCVDINGVEECGFKSVTSDFGLNVASQFYVADQVDERGITKEEDCVTTSTSGWGMLSNPNLQSGVETSLGGDAIANTGIVRICASTNPKEGIVEGNDVYCDMDDEDKDSKCASGKHCERASEGVETSIGICVGDDKKRQVSTGRWVDVGFCDVDSVRCWLDSSTVEGNLKEYMTVNELSVDDLVRDSEDLQELKNQYNNVGEKLNSLKADIGGLKDNEMVGGEEKELTVKAEEIVKGLDEIAGIEKGYSGEGSNNDKAEALSLKADLYARIVVMLLEENPELRVIGTAIEVEEDVVDCDVICKGMDKGYVRGDSKVEECDEKDVVGDCCCYGVVEEVVEDEDVINDDKAVIKEMAFIKEYIAEAEGSKRVVYEIDYVKHIGIGHKITAESRDLFNRLLGCDNICFNALIAGETELTDTQVKELFEYEIENTYVPRTKELFDYYDGYPSYVKMALVSAVYRGEMKEGHRTVSLINEGRWGEAALEYVKRKDYCEAISKNLEGVKDRMDANQDIFLDYAEELGQSVMKESYRAICAE